MSQLIDSETAYPPTSRSRVRLFSGRGAHDKQTVHAAIDAALYATVAWTLDDQPYATPTMVWREDDVLFWHGSAGSRMLRTLAAAEQPVCVTFTQLDGIVLSRLASAHTLNYRSVMAFGIPIRVEAKDERRRQMRNFLERLFPARWDEVRQPSDAELESIIMVRMRIDEASLKKRSGPPADGAPVFGGEGLFAQRAWAGQLPLETVIAEPVAGRRLHAQVDTPAYLTTFAERFGLRTAASTPPADEPASLAVEIAEAELLGPRVRRLRLRGKNGRALPAAAAGANVEVDVVGADGTWDQRPYSIVAADPDGAYYEIAVLLEASGRGGSAYLHQVRAGDTLRISRPVNAFGLASDAVHSVLIAGGIGITPIVAMARELAREHRSFEAHYTFRGAGNAVYARELIERANANVYDTAAGARFDPQRLAPYVAGHHVYVCGPHALIEAVIEAARGNGFPEEAIHREVFKAPPPLPTDRPIAVELTRSGMTIDVAPAVSILDAVLAAGIRVPHSCKRGECRECATRIVAGTADARDLCLTDAEREADRLTCICVSRAHGERLSLDL